MSIYTCHHLDSILMLPILFALGLFFGINFFQRRKFKIALLYVSLGVLDVY